VVSWTVKGEAITRGATATFKVGSHPVLYVHLCNHTMHGCLCICMHIYTHPCTHTRTRNVSCSWTGCRSHTMRTSNSCWKRRRSSLHAWSCHKTHSSRQARTNL
jgi:hypothetical protein